MDKTNDRAGACHLARQYENADMVSEAIKYYTKAEVFNNAIRLAKEHGLRSEMLSLAMRASKADMIEAAEYCEMQPGLMDKAVALYHKGGRITKALELCFKYNLFQALADISEDLDAGADPELLERAADFFVRNGQHSKAVSLLVAAKKYDEAVDMCVAHNVIITEELAEKMTPDKGEESEGNEARNGLLERIADCCAAQVSGLYLTRLCVGVWCGIEIDVQARLEAIRSLLFVFIVIFLTFLCLLHLSPPP